MTRAYAAVARGGIAVTPYGIRRVTTADGTLLYQHEDDEIRVLVAPWVAAQMTDLLQGVVAHGTGRAADLGRPIAGKTGTTTSNKDGWFIGFSSGLTTGVWMGRDDNRALPGLPAAAPRRAPSTISWSRAVANRPAEAFDTEAAAPDWQIEQDEEFWFAPPEDDPLVDADGNPVEPAPPPSRTSRAASRSRRPARKRRRRSGSTRNGSTGRSTAPPPSRERPPQRRRSASASASEETASRRTSRRRSIAVSGRCGRSDGVRRLRGAATSAAGLGSAPSSCSTRAWNSGPWFIWTRCATSWATVARRTNSGARISRQL